MVNTVDKFFVKMDNICDYIPIVSTLSNLTDLFQKCIVNLVNQSSAINSRYYTHLKQKSALRCIVLIIPVIGNIIVAIFDFLISKLSIYRNFMLAAIQKNSVALYFASEQLKGDRDFMLAASHQNVLAIAFASVQIRRDLLFTLSWPNRRASQCA